MCFYYAVVKVNTKILVEKGVIKEEQLSLFPDNYFVNGFEFPLMPVVADENPGIIQMFHWGLVPKTVRSKEEAVGFLKQYNTLNAKSETIFASRLFAEPVLKRRCLVLCSGFFEWRHKNPEDRSSAKYPFYVTLKDEGMFVFAGVWSSFTDRETGETIKTYSVITTPANELMEIVHNSKKRMPMILDPDSAINWLSAGLDEARIKSFFKPFDPSKMKARPIAKINPYLTGSNNQPGINVYYEYGELGDLLKSYPDYFEQSVDLR
jgi:putative SOS response-associated peptidase YedK